jgi:hypothetical protein
MATTTITNKDELVTAQAKEHDLSEVENASSSSEEHFDKKTAAQIRHRVDWRLIPALGAMVRCLPLPLSRTIFTYLTYLLDWTSN